MPQSESAPRSLTPMRATDPGCLSSLLVLFPSARDARPRGSMRRLPSWFLELTPGCRACLRSWAANAALPRASCWTSVLGTDRRCSCTPGLAPILSSPCPARQVPCGPWRRDTNDFLRNAHRGNKFPPHLQGRPPTERPERRRNVGRRAVRLRAQSGRGYSPGRSASVRVHHGGARAHAPHGAPGEALGNASAVAVGGSGRW
jgi:hypothetical protein